MTSTPRKRPVSSRPAIAQIGLGYWGQNILKTLASFDLPRIVVFDLDEARLRREPSLSPRIECAPSMESILADPGIAAVCVATPVEQHAKQVRAILRAGKHVFVEKPLARSFREAAPLVAEARRSGRHTMVGHIYLHHPALVELRRWISSGRLGEIYWLRTTRCSLGPRVRDDVDVLWDYAIHDAYLAPFLMGREVTRVRADGRSSLKPPRADWVEFSLEFRGSKAVMHGFVSWLNPVKERNLMVVGSRGIAVFDESKDPCLTLHRCGFARHRGRDTWGNMDLRLFDEGQETFSCPGAQTLRLELAHFITHLNRRTAPRASVSDGLTTLRLLETLSRSLAKNGAWLHTA